MPRKHMVGLLLFFAGTAVFAQITVLRNYVGRIHQTYRPEFTAYMNNFKAQFESWGSLEAAESINEFLTTPFGSGFVYVDGAGNNYIITNQHVVAQADTLSISFEDAFGQRTTHDGLTIFAADENLDIAILAFPEGNRPFAEGLTFLNRSLSEGDDVFAAGFPLVGGIQTWEFARGMVSTVLFRLADLNGTDMRRGPYVRHSARIDPGNSGGPLLITQQDGSAGYAVAGINTFGLRRNQSAQYAISARQVTDYIALSLAPKESVRERDAMTARVDGFIEELRGANPAFPRIAKYLSSACTAANVEYAMMELFTAGTPQIQADITGVFVANPIDGLNYAVAQIIETSLRGGTRDIQVIERTVVPNDNAGYTVTMSLQDKRRVDSTWINEYGIWRIQTFGKITGDTVLLEAIIAQEQKKEAEEKQLQRATANDPWIVFLGYAHLFEHGANPFAKNPNPWAVTASFKLRFKNFFTAGIHLYSTGPEFFQADGALGANFPIRMKKFALTPYIDIGGGFRYGDKSNPGAVYKYNKGEFAAADPGNIRYTGTDFGGVVQAGMMLTSVYLPGLFISAAYQYNYFYYQEKGITEYGIKPENRHFFSAGIGYSF